MEGGSIIWNHLEGDVESPHVGHVMWRVNGSKPSNPALLNSHQKSSNKRLFFLAYPFTRWCPSGKLVNITQMKYRYIYH